MSFQQPLALLGLLGVLALLGMYLLAQRRRRAFTLRFTNLELLSSVVGRRPGYRRHIPPALLLLAAAGLVVAMAGPILHLEVARNDASVILAIDVSGSMAATDVQPTRLDAARHAASDLIDQLPGNARIGLVSFNGYANLEQGLTDNRTLVRDALESLHANGGTAIGDGLELATRELMSDANRAKGAGGTPASKIILLTDGASNRGADPLQAAAQAKAENILVDTVGIGSRDAAVSVQGQPIGGVDEQSLSAIASATGGHYYYAQEAGQLSQIYSTLGSEFGWRPIKVDVTVPLMITGVALLVASAAASLLWFRVLP